MATQRYTAVFSTIANSFCDATLDYAVNRFNYHKVLLFSALIAFFGQLFVGVSTNISFPLASLPYVSIHAVLVLLGYVCFIRALKFIPVALVGLIEASSLFLTFMIDATVGYIQLTPYFLLTFLLFVFAIYLFIGECLRQDNVCLKVLKPEGFAWVIASVLFYVAAPYLVKTSHFYGANEIAINIGYYVVAIPYFAYQYVRASVVPWVNVQSEKRWWNNFYFLCLVIGGLEALYYVFETLSFINDAPTVVVVIEQMRIFLMFVFSVMFGMDRFTLRKTMALFLGMLAVVGVYYS